MDNLREYENERDGALGRLMAVIDAFVVPESLRAGLKADIGMLAHCATMAGVMAGRKSAVRPFPATHAAGEDDTLLRRFTLEVLRPGVRDDGDSCYE